MILFGSRASSMGYLEIENSQCKICKTKRKQIINRYGLYFHIFWVPVFPLGSKTFCLCTHCSAIFHKKEFNEELQKIYTQKKWMLKRPVWHWLGLIYLILLVVLAFIFSEFYWTY